ncbi:MAG: hypothetical protein P8Y45_17675 [Exilibacterium sp.]
MPGKRLNLAAKLNRRRLRVESTLLVCVTTCGRPELLGDCLVPLRQCLSEVRGVDLVVAVDGLSAPGNWESLVLAQSLGIACVVADHSEGVGVSKNRVVALLGGYDYYFFIDDDVTVISERLFPGHVELFLESGIHHFSLHDPARLQGELAPAKTKSCAVIRHALYGGAAVNFFTRQALQAAGGWHWLFSKLRRGGHTEHSYRIYRAGLCPAPFNFAEGLIDCCIWNNPPSVISATGSGAKVGKNRLYEIENRLIEDALEWIPFTAAAPGKLIKA